MKIGAIILAAGAARRMGGENKLLKAYRGKPLVQWAMEAAKGAGLAPIVLVTGRDSVEITALGASIAPMDMAHNSDAEQGLSSSLKLGAARPGAVDGAIVLLGDMPGVDDDLLQTLIAAFEPGAYAVAPEKDGALGNPVLLSAAALLDCAGLEGDYGARRLILAPGRRLIRVPVATDAIFADFDTPEDFTSPC